MRMRPEPDLLLPALPVSLARTRVRKRRKSTPKSELQGAQVKLSSETFFETQFVELNRSVNAEENIHRQLIEPLILQALRTERGAIKVLCKERCGSSLFKLPDRRAVLIIGLINLCEQRFNLRM